MKKVIISLLALLLLAAQAQAQKQPLAVLVVGVDSWMFGDVIAHIVGEELKRGNPDLVPVTREKFVQNKLKALRRATGWINYCELRDWANEQGLSQVCLVEAKAGGSNTAFSFTHAQQKYSAQVIDATSNTSSCVANFTFNRGGGGEMAPAELTKVAWEVVGRLQSNSCKTPHHIRCYMFEPEMVFVAGGEFTMGCLVGRDTQSGTSCRPGEYPTTQVMLSPFWIGKYEITQSTWEAVMEKNYKDWLDETYPRAIFRCIGDSCPAGFFSYSECVDFIERLNTHTGKTYQLPTEAQWEYAARGGASTHGYEYSGSNTKGDVAWYFGNSGDNMGTENPRLHVVGTRAGNELGIHDMSGNIWEWCQDWYADVLPSGTNPLGPTKDESTMNANVIRGGSFSTWDNVDVVRVAYRHWRPSHRFTTAGLRVVLPQ
jgi:formylglycine-generating enzyme required for sulfatase activity